jgi:acetylornithine/N-succinyldiaminopimelate aminotransferase
MMNPLLPVYERADLAFERGEGCNLYTAEGRRYLDFAAGIAVAAFGHANPRLVKALSEQAQKIWIVSNTVRIPAAERNAKRLTELTFADTVFFQNSGVEAWELGVKLVRHYFWAKGEAHKNRIITCKGNFHGRTIAAISAVKTEKMVKGFAPLLDGFDQVEFNSLDALEAAITPNTAAIHFEPVQGEGGLAVGSLEYLKDARALCDKYGLLLYLDEIQCGMGRTGKLFAHEWADITPDVMCVAKGFGGGFPVAACLATEAVGSSMTVGSHGSTYGCNPLAMAVVEEILALVSEPGFLPHINRVSDYLTNKLEVLVKAHPKKLLERRGLGLMQGLKCSFDPLVLLRAARERGLMTVGAGENVLRLLPPLIVSEKEVDEAVDILSVSLENLPA